MTELLDLAERAAKLALARGANEVATQSYRSRNVELVWRDGKVEKISDSTSRGVNFQLYVDGRYSAVRSSDLRAEALDAFVDQAIRMARTLSVDAHRRLPDPKWYEGRTKADLQLVDVTLAQRTAADRVAFAQSLEDAARARDTRRQLISVTSGCGDGENESALVHSNGFADEAHDTYCWCEVSAATRDADGRRPEEDAAAYTRFLSELPSAQTLGALATERALARMGAKRAASAMLPMVVESRCAGRLIGILLRCLTGRALQQKQSLYEGKQGTRIASTALTIKDDPFLPRGIGSRVWDGEGITAKRFAVIERGILRNFYVDNYYGRKLGRSPSTGTASNLVFEPGTLNADQMIASLKHGMLVTRFLGGNANDTTGDFSLGVQGFVIRDGKRVEPFAEMNISGNQAELWRQLRALGNDPFPFSSIRVPTLWFEAVQFSGA